MTTDKTLATAKHGFTTGHCQNNKQPGGCQLHNLQCGWPSCDRRAAEPSLATAKHGGCVQLGTSERERFDAWLEARSVDTTRWGDGEYTDPAAYNYWLAWQAALAARQPEAQERVAWASTGATGHKVVAMPGLHKLPYGDYDLYAAPPAQAVDLEQFRDSVVQAISNVSYMTGYGPAYEKLTELLALIDGKAVGNG